MLNKDEIPKIVVLTPVKNESWILDRFLAVTSQFADHIIVADQNSTDGSLSICKKYSKVILIENKANHFNEAERQILLIQTAREIISGPKILLPLDADEILAANAAETLGWQSMLKAAPGTVLCIEKPDLYPGDHRKCIRYNDFNTIGYVDDGADHIPKIIHSIRIPISLHSPKLYIQDVKLLHYAYTSLSRQASKMRWYSVLENTLSHGNCFSRRLAYIPKWKIDDGPNSPFLDTTDPAWFDKWEELGIDMHTVFDESYYWRDFEVLHFFNERGKRQFWFEDIWDFDWETCRQYAKLLGLVNIPDYEILPPPKIIRLCMKILTHLYKRARDLKINLDSLL